MITQHSPVIKWVITLWNGIKSSVKYALGCVLPALCWQALPWGWVKRQRGVLMSPLCILCPALQLHPSCTLNWAFEVKMCPPVPLPAVTWHGNLYEQEGPKSSQQWLFQSPPRDSPQPTCRDLDLLLIRDICMFGCERQMHFVLTPWWQTVRGACKSQLLLLPTHGNKTNWVLFYFLTRFEQAEYRYLGP